MLESSWLTDHGKPWARDLTRRLHRWEGCTPARCRAAARGTLDDWSENYPPD